MKCATLSMEKMLWLPSRIQEVKNAIKAYELFDSFNPFEQKDLLKAHGVMMAALTEDAGHFRRGNVGVFSEAGLVHMAPPADGGPFDGRLVCLVADGRGPFAYSFLCISLRV